MEIEEIKFEIDSRISELNTILVNLNKAPNRTYRKNFLIEKKKQSTEICNSITNLLQKHEGKFTSTEVSFYVHGAKQKYSSIKTILNEKLELAIDLAFSLKTIALAFTFFIKLKNKRNLKRNMAKVDLKLGNSLVDTYGGEPEKLESFLESAKLFADLTDAENATPQAKQAALATVFRFVKTRLTGSARHVIAQANTLDELSEALKKTKHRKKTHQPIFWQN